ncbi:MAG: hypothetical protein D3916_03525 [Candidatus Electrothrix sp. MAN1_4]|nr:hypothetical protein [Candidatus Electrothrix sp. MAN1_4]
MHSLLFSSTLEGREYDSIMALNRARNIKMIFGKIIVFLLGMCVAVQVVAAFYRILDFWYTIRTEYPIVIKGIFFWCGLSSLIALFMGQSLRPAFLWGMLFYLPFYVANFFLLQGIIKYRYKKGEQVLHEKTHEMQEK